MSDTSYPTEVTKQTIDAVKHAIVGSPVPPTVVELMLATGKSRPTIAKALRALDATRADSGKPYRYTIKGVNHSRDKLLTDLEEYLIAREGLSPNKAHRIAMWVWQRATNKA